MPVYVELDDADGTTLVEVMKRLQEKPVEVDPAAERFLDCMVVTVHGGRALPASEALRLMAAELRRKGIVVTETARFIEVRRASDAPPCARR
jgi:hypothetical protein